MRGHMWLNKVASVLGPLLTIFLRVHLADGREAAAAVLVMEKETVGGIQRRAVAAINLRLVPTQTSLEK